MFDEGRVRFELENHAHDIYDAFHAIHAGRVRKETFFHYDELVRIIEAAHHTARVPGVSGVHEVRPLMGRNVLVSNLWETRDLWAWLAPEWNNLQREEVAKSVLPT